MDPEIPAGHPLDMGPFFNVCECVCVCVCARVLQALDQKGLAIL